MVRHLEHVHSKPLTHADELLMNLGLKLTCHNLFELLVNYYVNIFYHCIASYCFTLGKRFPLTISVYAVHFFESGLYLGNYF